MIQIYFFVGLPPRGESMVEPAEYCEHLHNVFAWIPASNGIRDGSDLALIREEVIECEEKICRVGL